MDYITTRLRLKDVFPHIELSENIGELEEDVPYIRKGYENKAQDINNEDRTITNYINTLDVDRDNEVVLPKGAILTDYKKNPIVLWAHTYNVLPIGKSLWIKRDKKGLISKTQYANHAEADKVFQYRKDGFPLAESIGFIPLEFVSNGKGWYPESDPEQYQAVLKNWQDEYKNVYGKKPKAEPNAIITKWLQLEYSDVPVPSNPEALELAKSKGLKIYTIDKAAIEEKSVIPYKDLGKDDEGAPWNAAAEIKAADVKDLKLMCAWYDKGNADNKGAYKLPHHHASNHKSVWGGVRAAMAVLFGARGGVNIPDGDRKGVYNHLVKHYKEYNKTPPDFKEYEDEESILGIEEVEDILELEPEKEVDIDEAADMILSIGELVKSKGEEMINNYVSKLDEKLIEAIERKKGKVI